MTATTLLVAAIGVNAASAKPLVYCERPSHAGAYLAASVGVTCATARRVERALETVCYRKIRCEVAGFRCVAYLDGRFDRPFQYTNHALCNARWSWIEWDGG
jgi:hypothetical protein